MTHGEIDPSQQPPQPFDAEPPDLNQHPVLSSGDFTNIYNFWKNPDTLDISARQEAVRILTRPRDVILDEHHPKKSQSDLLDISPSGLREELRGSLALADELYGGIWSWYAYYNNTEPGEENMAQVQVKYQALIAEILPMVNRENRENLLLLYPLVGSLATKHGLVDYQPTAQLIKDPEVSQARKKQIVAKWTGQAKSLEKDRSEREIALQRQAYKWLGQFAEEWCKEDSVDPELVERIVGFLEEHAAEPDRPYVNPMSFGEAALQIGNEDLRYRFSVRHILYRQGENDKVPELTGENPKNDEMLAWMLDEVNRKINHSSFLSIRKHPVDEKTLRLRDRIEACLPGRPIIHPHTY